MKLKLLPWVMLIALVLSLSPSADAAHKHKKKQPPQHPANATVEGRVFRGTTAGVGGAVVTLKRAGHHHHRHRKRTGKAGSYAMHVPAGRYLAIASKHGSKPARVHFTVQPNQKANINLYLTAKRIGHHRHHHHHHVVVHTPKTS